MVNLKKICGFGTILGSLENLITCYHSGPIIELGFVWYWQRFGSWFQVWLHGSALHLSDHGVLCQTREILGKPTWDCSVVDLIKIIFALEYVLSFTELNLSVAVKVYMKMRSLIRGNLLHWWCPRLCFFPSFSKLIAWCAPWLVALINGVFASRSCLCFLCRCSTTLESLMTHYLMHLVLDPCLMYQKTQIMLILS